MLSPVDLSAMSQTQRVTYALTLSLIAPSEEYARTCWECADSFAVGLSDAQIKACKAAVTLGLHPVDLGDLPQFVQLGACAHLLPLDQKNVQSNWKTRYPGFLEKRRPGGLWVNVRECDRWLDERGKKLLSSGLLEEKKRRNPGWAPAGDRLDALAGTQNEMINKLAELVAQRLHANNTIFDGAAK